LDYRTRVLTAGEYDNIRQHFHQTLQPFIKSKKKAFQPELERFLVLLLLFNLTSMGEIFLAH